jgi:cyclomaltodextrinase / maltogenic alpha-amylase / neopullulanase
MTTPAWVQDAVFYQIFPDRFARSGKMPEIDFESWDSAPTPYGFKGGNLYGAAEKLDYLNELGVTAIYLNPIFSSASNHRYHTYDYYNVDPLLGGNDAFRHFLDEAHHRNMRVILDGVFNHASRGFWQFHHVLENGEGSPYKDWFLFDKDRLTRKRNWGAYPGKEEQKALDHNEDSLTAIGYRGWWNLPALPKFNTNSPQVREFIFDVAGYWIKFGIDGWRLDVPGEIDDDSFWREFRRRVKTLNPEAYIVAEIWHEAQRWLKGDQFDATMNYLITAGLLGYCGGSHLNMQEVNRVGGFHGRVHHNMNADGFRSHIEYLLGLYDMDTNRGQLNLLNSHDTPRFLTCVKNDKAALKLAWQFIFTFPGVPCIYYGDEIGLNGSHDPDCRKSFPWDESKWDRVLFEYIKGCIALRKAHPALRSGEYRSLYAADGVFAFERKLEKETLVVVMNTSEQTHRVQLDVFSRPPKIIFGEPAAISFEDKTTGISLEPRSSVVLE